VSYDIATPYTACYGIFRQNGNVAFLLRTNTPWMNDHYGLPAGKVEHNEAFIAAMVREAKEEIGVTIAPKDISHALTMHRKSADLLWVDVYFDITKWSGEPYNAEPNVHGALEWFDPKNLPQNVIPSVRAALEAIAAGETYCEFGWLEGQDG